MTVNRPEKGLYPDGEKEEEGEGRKEKEAKEEKHRVKRNNQFWKELIAYFSLKTIWIT